MKYFTKTINLIVVLIIVFCIGSKTFSKETSIKYSQENISNYFSGIVSLSKNETTASFKYLNKVRFLGKVHSNYNSHYIRSLILLEKFDEAFEFSKEIWKEEEFFFEADLLLGINSFLEKDYRKAKKYFKRLNITSEHNYLFEDFFGNILISWVNASENNLEESFKFFDKIPQRYSRLKNIQNSLLQCFFKTPQTEVAFKKVIGNKETGFSRYNFFLANYFISKNEIKSAELLLEKSSGIYDSNLLLKQANIFIKNKDHKKIKFFFDCKSVKHNIAEIFYIIANLYSTQDDYQLSNFYLRISLFLNDQFTPNKTLLAENFFFQKNYKIAKKIYKSVKNIGSVYSWHAAKSISVILLDTEGEEKSLINLEKEINNLKNPDFEKYFEIANFYKDNENYEKSIKYYSIALKKINDNHHLLPKILYRRGASYERMGDWDKAEKDLEKSLKILPDQPHVLNYLAYSWIEKRINLDKSLEMLQFANNIKKNDGYIIDSLGWAHYIKKNYIDAEKFLRQAVELMPTDPIVNDHYADALWMLNKNIQARYFWKYVLSLDRVEKELKDNINKKLIFGVTKKL